MGTSAGDGMIPRTKRQQSAKRFHVITPLSSHHDVIMTCGVDGQRKDDETNNTTNVCYEMNVLVNTNCTIVINT